MTAELTITGVVQREAWLQRVMPPAEQLGEDLWSLPVPIPDNPLRYVSVYAFGTGDGLVLIDAGWGAEESWRALRDGLESIGAGVADVRGVLVTHMHFDHVGLAGRVRQASGAWIAPLGDYLDSLARTRDLDVDEVLPAHEWRFRGLPGRVDAITAHHERRLAELLAAIRRRPGSTPWQLAGELTWSRPWDQYSRQMRIFAVTETAAHAHLLERRGLVTASRTRPPAYTARAA